MNSERNRYVRIEINRDQLKICLVLFLICGWVAELGSESINLTTTYPSPVGIYNRIITTGGPAAAPVDTLLARDRGNVGIGIVPPAVPRAKLDVAGGVKIGPTNVACVATNAGTLRYRTTPSPPLPPPPIMEYCDGTAWKPFGAGGGTRTLFGPVNCFGYSSSCAIMCPVGWVVQSWWSGQTSDRGGLTNVSWYCQQL